MYLYLNDRVMSEKHCGYKMSQMDYKNKELRKTVKQVF